MAVAMAIMAASKMMAVVVVVLAVALATTLTTAQSSPEEFVALHNAARRASGVTRNVVWNSTVAAYAEWWAGQRAGDCKLQHSPDPTRWSFGYGENIIAGGGPGATTSAADAVRAWAAERPNYDYASNRCQAGTMCGHYTQVVWSRTTSIGCARVACTNGGGVFITCNYYPAGNVAGERPF